MVGGREEQKRNARNIQHDTTHLTVLVETDVQHDSGLCAVYASSPCLAYCATTWYVGTNGAWQQCHLLFAPEISHSPDRS